MSDKFDKSKIAFGVGYLDGAENGQVFVTPRPDIVRAVKAMSPEQNKLLRKLVLKKFCEEVALAEKDPVNYMPIKRPSRSSILEEQ